MSEINPGNLLISHPFLKDPNFMRTVVYMCEVSEQGGIGFVLNRPFKQTLQQIIEGIDGTDFTIYTGGPVQPDTLHFIHRCPQIISGGIELGEGIFWGGDFEQVLYLINTRQLQANDIRFFIGYSGWDKDQLAEELLEDTTWITGYGNQQLVFSNNADAVWKQSLQNLGGRFAQMVNYPIDPQLN